MKILNFTFKTIETIENGDKDVSFLTFSDEQASLMNRLLKVNPDIEPYAIKAQALKLCDLIEEVARKYGCDGIHITGNTELMCYTYNELSLRDIPVYVYTTKGLRRVYGPNDIVPVTALLK